MYARAVGRATAVLSLAVLAAGLAAGCGSDGDPPRGRAVQTPSPLDVVPPNGSSVDVRDEEDGGGWFFLLATGACALVAGAAAGAAGAHLLRRDAGQAPVAQRPVASSPPPPPPPPATNDSRLVADRTALINTLIRLDSRLDNPAMREQVSAGLARAGVEVIEVAEGTAFDALKHQAGGAAYTDDVSKHMTVCATEQSGYRDRGKVLQLPIVTIYTYPGA
jgi:molecular chaperone GrpE